MGDLELSEEMQVGYALACSGSKFDVGQPGWLSGLVPPLAQGLPGDPGSHPMLGSAWSLLLPLPVSLSLSISAFLMNK